MHKFNPEKKRTENCPLEDTWILEEHLTELFSELFRSHFLLEQKIQELQVEIEQLRQKFDFLARR